MMERGKERGTMFLLLVLIISIVVLGIGYVVYQDALSQKSVLRTVKEQNSLLYLAELGIGYAVGELRNHGYDWFTHVVDTNHNLKKNPNFVPSCSLKNTSLDGDNVYIVYNDPANGKYVYVKTYRSGDMIWILSRGVCNGKEKIIRMALGRKSLYDYFNFYSNTHTFWKEKFDGKGFGKIYVNGDIIFRGARGIVPEFVNVKELSTNRSGIIKLNSWRAYPPYYFDKPTKWREVSHLSPDDSVDGYAFLATYDGEFGFKRGFYPSELPSEMRFASPVPYAILSPLYPSWHFNSPPKFTFDPHVMPDIFNTNLDEPVDITMPKKLDGANWLFDLYRGDDMGEGEAVNEYPVKFVRLYYIGNDGHAHVIGDPKNAPKGKKVYAQVYDMKDTAKEVPGGKIYFLGRYIEVNENVVSAYKDASGNYIRFDPDYEREFWKRTFWYNNEFLENASDYIRNGYYRETEKIPVDYLNTGGVDQFGSDVQAEPFRKWLEDPTKDGTLDLSKIIHEKHTGAKNVKMPAIDVTFSQQAMNGGIWIGWDKENKDKLKVCTGDKNTGTSICKSYGVDNLPEWISVSEFYAGSKPNYFFTNDSSLSTENFKSNCIKTKSVERHLKVIDLDLSKAGEVLNKSNGVIWLEPTNDANKYGYDGIRLLNGETIPREGGITVVTPRSIFVKGALNKHTHDPGTCLNDPEWQPVSLITDSYVVLLSDKFSDPDSPPDYISFPHPGTKLYDPKANTLWINYLAYRFKEQPIQFLGFKVDETNFLPKDEDSWLVKYFKCEAIVNKIMQYINSRKDSAKCALPRPFLEWYLLANPPHNEADIKAIVDAVFNLTHNGSLKFSDTSELYLGASVVASTKNKRGDVIQFLESMDSQIRLIWRGSFIDVGDSWSNAALIYDNTARPFGWVRRDIFQERIVEDYTNAYPPGDFSGGAGSIWYVDDSENAFNRHPY